MSHVIRGFTGPSCAVHRKLETLAQAVHTVVNRPPNKPDYELVAELVTESVKGTEGAHT